MSADLYINIIIEEGDIPLIANYMRNNHGFRVLREGREIFQTLKRDHRDGDQILGIKSYESRHSDQEYSEASGRTIELWIGQVSWLKAMILEDKDTFIPSVVERVSEILPYGVPRILTKEKIDALEEAFKLPNQTQYRIGNLDEVLRRLKKNIGQFVYTSSA